MKHYINLSTANVSSSCSKIWFYFLFWLFFLEDESPIKTPVKGKKKVEETAKKTVAGGAGIKKPKKDKKDAKESVTKATGKNPDGEKKKITEAAKKKTVDEKGKSAVKKKSTTKNSKTKEQ